MFYSVKSTAKKKQPALLTCSLFPPTDLRKSSQQEILEFLAAHFKKHQLSPLTLFLLTLNVDLLRPCLYVLSI